MRTLGWPFEFRAQPWPSIASHLHGALDGSAAGRTVLDIVDSIIATGAEALLAGTTSMFDVVVTPKPVTPAPVDVVVVRQTYGTVTIEHLTHTGRNDRIQQPAHEGVALFWQFMIEKFGVHPTPTGAPPDGRPS
ncbi:hypothetical protein [Micromonospora sp. DT31]|uniref:hypothetical protein n=1 Tax=Micromonospora sp. DT31 TaxID=3393434 RepID=UPI003CFA71A0